jgi:hypothetical protein
MSYTPRYDRGDWNAICDVCGRQMKASALRQRWDGLKTCQEDWEPRQPQDFVRGVADYQAPPFTRPEQSNNFLPITIIYDNNGNLPINLVVSNCLASIKTQLFKLFKTNIVTSTVTIIRARRFTYSALSTSLATLTKVSIRSKVFSIVSTSLATLVKSLSKPIIPNTTTVIFTLVNKINKEIKATSTNLVGLTIFYIISPTKTKKAINGKDNVLNINILG